MNTVNRCPACDSEKWKETEQRAGYQLAMCERCRLTFTRNPDYNTERYVEVYEAADSGAAFSDRQPHLYAAPEERLRLEVQAFLLPPPRLTPAERIAVRWLRQHTPKSGTVVECGCGTGRVLRALTSAGVSAMGVEVSEVMVRTLAEIGVRARKGAAPDFPWEGPAPFAVAFFEVLEHFADPYSILSKLKARFPSAAIVASVPSPFRLAPGQSRGDSDWPPHHFLRWTPEAMKAFFKRLGYARVEVHVPPAVGAEYIPGLGQLVRRAARKQAVSLASPRPAAPATQGPATAPGFKTRLKATTKVWANRTYQSAATVLGFARARRVRKQGVSASSMLVIAEP